MKICYIDEAGDTGPLKAATDSTQPVLVLGALIIDYRRLEPLTQDYLDLKQRLFPAQCQGASRLGRILPEIKGAEIRKHVGRGTNRQYRHAVKFLDDSLDLLDKHAASLVARVWIKGVGGNFDGMPVYSSSIQAIYTYFQRYLTDENDYGMVIADSRTKGLNVPVSHSIFTQKFRSVGDSYDRIYELPTFAHSDNHAGLQLCDTICSALLFPISSYVYCSGHVANVHVQSKFADLKSRYGAKLRDMQFRYQDPRGKWSGGVVVSDAIAQRSGKLLFI